MFLWFSSLCLLWWLTQGLACILYLQLFCLLSSIFSLPLSVVCLFVFCIRLQSLRSPSDRFVCLFGWLVGWFVGFLTFASTTRQYRGRAPSQSVRQFYSAATHETELGDHDFCLSWSHYPSDRNCIWNFVKPISQTILIQLDRITYLEFELIWDVLNRSVYSHSHYT